MGIAALHPSYALRAALPSGSLVSPTVEDGRRRRDGDPRPGPVPRKRGLVFTDFRRAGTLGGATVEERLFAADRRGDGGQGNSRRPCGEDRDADVHGLPASSNRSVPVSYTH